MIVVKSGGEVCGTAKSRCNEVKVIKAKVDLTQGRPVT